MSAAFGNAPLGRMASTAEPAADRLEVHHHQLETPPELPTVPVGPFLVADASVAEVVERLAFPGVGLTVACALHVGGLNHRSEEKFVTAMNRADVVYCDGKSVQWIAQNAGATAIERAATTDIGLPAIARTAENLGRPVRVAIVGGAAGLAERAAATIEEAVDAQIVLTDHGYHRDWDGVLERLRQARPDVTIIGMGMPKEARWVDRHRAALPAGLVLTCGGWLGFLAGDEQRAPGLAQKSGFEWMYRLLQSPRRLGPRYGRGLASFATLVVQARLGRRRVRSRPA